MIKIIFNLTLIIGCISATGGWSYAERDKWGDFSAICEDGNKQSPIDIKYADSFKVGYLKKLNIIQDQKSKEKMILSNNGHTLVLNIKSDIKLNGAALGNKYKVAQVHFHWGRVNSKGSEHYRDSRQFAMEMHVVTFDSSKYSTLDAAVNHYNGVAVVAVLFKVTRRENLDLNNIIQHIPKVKEQHSETKVKSFKLQSLMHVNRLKYYRYYGSLTTPGCQQSVIWTVMESPNHLSQKQINIFRTAKHSGHTLSGNFRHPQDLNNRRILRSFNRR